jgi:hypothetical protein
MAITLFPFLNPVYLLTGNLFRRKCVLTLTFDFHSHSLARYHRIGERWPLSGDTAPQGLSFALLASTWLALTIT